MTCFQTISQLHRSKIIIRKSVFITTVTPVNSGRFDNVLIKQGDTKYLAQK